jgi:hypothetical protein
VRATSAAQKRCRLLPQQRPQQPAERSQLATLAARPARLILQGWHGVTSTPVLVVGETPKRYRIRAIERTRLAGRGRWLETGEEELVPRGALRFDPPAPNAGHQPLVAPCGPWGPHGPPNPPNLEICEPDPSGVLALAAREGFTVLPGGDG